MKNTLSFLSTDQASSHLRRAAPASIRTARIVSVTDGYQLRATLAGSNKEWTLTSPGGIADTFGDLLGLRQFATVVLGIEPTIQSPMHLSFN